MKIIEVPGSPARIGQTTGEALREEIRDHIAMYPQNRPDEFHQRLPLFLDVLRRHLPHVLTEMEATASGADVPLEEILRLNLLLDADACTNIVFTGGMVGTLDGMNAEGLAVGHSSVGSIFQQSDHHPPIRLWGYDALSRCRTTADFVRRMSALPLRGKGYSLVCVDRDGVACSIAAPAPPTACSASTATSSPHCARPIAAPRRPRPTPWRASAS